MNIIFDEVIGEILPDFQPQTGEQKQSEAPPRERSMEELRSNLRRLMVRDARLSAD
jgi:hypothetical protein